MDKQEYNDLTKIGYEEVTHQIIDRLRGDARTDYPTVYIVALSTMALTLSITKERDAMLRHIKAHIADETTLSYLIKLEKEDYSYIKDLSKKFDKETLKAAILFTEPHRFSATHTDSTPQGISQLALSLMEIEKGDTILDLGSGMGSFLAEAALSLADGNLYGVEINTENVIIANLRRFVSRLPIKIVQGNIISQDYSNLKANKVFSNYPLGMRLGELKKYLSNNQKLNKYFKDARMTISGDWVYAMGAYLNTSMPGKTVVLMTNAGTWNKPDEELRKMLVDNGLVEGVVLLPERLLASTLIPLTMLILSQGNNEVRMVDASAVYTQGRRQNSLEHKDIDAIVKAYYNKSDISRSVKKDEIAEQEYILNPQRYVGYDIDIPNGISLGELCKFVNRGAMIRSGELDDLASNVETEYKYLMLQNIQDGLIDTDLPCLTEISEEYEKHCISDKDLIISKLSPFKVAMAHVEENNTILANGNLYFIELDSSKVNPVYVMVFLQSEAGMAQLNMYAKGTAMKSISIRDLKNIKIPNIPLEEQDRIAQEYENLNDELSILQRQSEIIRDKKAKLLQGVI